MIQDYATTYRDSVLVNQLEIDDKLRDSERGQLMKDRDRNGQYKSSNEEKLLLYMNPFSEKNTSISPIESEKQNFFLLPL